MTSETLRKAREFEARYMPFIPESERPAFHVTGGIGWINDPNGFSTYRGEYHLFFQYHPYSTQWGPMHWGHVKTRDFIRWERLPVALAPDEPYDADGCFSGSAVELPDGRQLLLYTGVRNRRRADGVMESIQNQCVAVGDGVNYEKYGDNPVITGADLPEGCSELDFRDPKIWRESDGSYHCVVGDRTSDGSGAALHFISGDGFRWRYAGVIDASRNECGRMWECPDYFPLDGRQALIVSPQEMAAQGLEFHAGEGTVCFLGSADGPDGQFRRESMQAIDYGTDFYAPQTLEALDGRRIMIAWMQNWIASRCQPQGARFFGEMTLPRELGIRDGRLIQNPVRELEAYRGRAAVHSGVRIAEADGEVSLPGVSGRILDMTVTIRPEDGFAGFKIRLAKGDGLFTSIRLKPDGVIRVDRSHCGMRYDVVHVRDFASRWIDGAVRMRIVMDRHSLELFVNGGEQAASFIIHTPESADAITFEAGGAARIDVEKYDLNL